MRKCLLWGTGEVFRDNVNLVKFHEMNRQFKVVGITSETRIYSEYEGYRFFPKEEIHSVQFDFVIVMARKDVVRKIFHEAVNLGIPSDILFPYKVLSYSAFDPDIYGELRKNTPSIFSNNCWGGLTYHSLGLEFCSPLINVFESENDYLRLLGDPKKYMREKLELEDWKIGGNCNYFICRCGDIRLHFNHAVDFDEISAGWERRKQRINWDNLLVEMFTESKDVAERFCELPYEKKICFVPFETDTPSLVYLEFCHMDGMSGVPMWKIVNGMATGAYPYYDVFSLLETGQIKKISKFRQKI